MDGSSGGISHGAARIDRPIRIGFERLSIRGRLTSVDGDERQLVAGRILRVLVGSGRGCVLQASTCMPMVLVPLRGVLRLVDGESVRTLRPGQLSVMEPSACLQIDGSTSALWIALVASMPVWRQLFDATTETPTPDPVLLPALHPADRALRRVILRVAREASEAEGGSFERTPALIRFVTLLADLQSSFDWLISRCPGRSLAQRRTVFLRLQRAYTSMETNSGRGLGVPEFARIANYSACHFVRTFNAVYGETPHTVVTEQRLQRAHRLINETRLSVTEVARASGFEDRCAFARSFKQRFGLTASATRRSAEVMSI